MSIQWISIALRSQVRERANGWCEYCRVHDEDVGAPHEPDHIVAEQHGGRTTAENLAYACYHCNRYKGTNLASVDPDTGHAVFLFQPRKDRWGEHFKIDGPLIVGLTPVGRATAALLRYNTPERLESRRLLVLAQRYPC